MSVVPLNEPLSDYTDEDIKEFVSCESRFLLYN